MEGRSFTVNLWYNDEGQKDIESWVNVQEGESLFMIIIVQCRIKMPILP